MATVTKKGKRWYAIFQDASGKQRWVAGYYDKTETERLSRKLEDEQRAIRLGDIDPQSEARRVERAKPVTVQVAEYRDKLEAAGRTDGHVDYTIADIERLVEFSGVKSEQPIKSASEITVGLIDRWVKALKKTDANKTINRRVSSVQQFLRHLAETGGVTSYILNRYPKLPTGEHHRKRIMRPLVNGEVAKLLSVPNIERRELYTFALRTGLRLSECRAMVPAYFDFEQKTIRIPAHVAKAKTDQTVPIHNGIMAMLKNRCEGKAVDAPIFSMPTKQHVNDQLKTDCKAVGIDPKNVSSHSLRHTFCTLLARANVHPALLQKLARHSEVETTLKYYVHLNQDDQAAAINVL